MKYKEFLAEIAVQIAAGRIDEDSEIEFDFYTGEENIAALKRGELPDDMPNPITDTVVIGFGFPREDGKDRIILNIG